jgi:hypothetical protein
MSGLRDTIYAIVSICKFKIDKDTSTSSRLKLCEVGKNRLKMITKAAARDSENTRNTGVTDAMVTKAVTQDIVDQAAFANPVLIFPSIVVISDVSLFINRPTGVTS